MMTDPQATPVCTTRIINGEGLIDASLQRDIQHWIPAEFHQLDAGEYEGSCTAVSNGDVHLVQEHQNRTVRKFGATPENVCTISTARSTNQNWAFSQFRKTEDSWLFFMPENTEFDLQLPGESQVTYICLPQDRLMDGLNSLNPVHWARAPRDLTAFSTPLVDTFFSGLLKTIEHCKMIDSACQTPDSPIHSMLMDTILLTLNGSEAVRVETVPAFHSRLRSFRLVKMACEYIDACLAGHKVPSMVDICTQCETPVRTLQYYFLMELGLTPIAYLRVMRLNRARAALLAAEPSHCTVTQIAIDLGFIHLGRFAAHYLKLFGERPSETLARQRTSPTTILF